MDLDISDVLGVPTIALRFVVLAARAPVQIDETVIISRRYYLLVFAHLNDVDVAAVSAWWVDPVNEPAELHRVTRPRGRRRS